MKSLLNDRLDHYPITTPVSYTPRLFHLSSSTGWFRAIEETHIACPEDMSLVPDHFPFIQETVYNAVQPGTHVHILIVSNIRRSYFKCMSFYKCIQAYDRKDLNISTPSA